MLVNAPARADRWQRILEMGESSTINELADRERIAPSYMTPSEPTAQVRFA